LELQGLVFSVVGQGNESVNLILQIVYLGSFLLFMLYGQKFQTWVMLREISGAVNRLKGMKDDARTLAIQTVKEIGQDKADPAPRIDHFMELFTILPASLDPSGIVPKIKNVFDVREKRFEDEIQLIAPNADKTWASNLEGVLEVAMGINQIYRIVNHFYLLGKKSMSLYVIMQIQMQLPLIMRMAEAYSEAIKAFAEGQPIGDGIGALVAAKLMYGHTSHEVAKEIVAAEVVFEGRTLLVLKAEGPGSTVGKPGEAIKNAIEVQAGNVNMVIMIDAAGKYEGEKSGETSEGVGAAIGGIGVDQYTIEEISLKHGIPVHAVIVKESIEESVSPMTKDIFNGADVALARVKRIILEGTKEGDTVIVAGIGNTVGIGQ
jgi:hypothetical protein